MGPTPLLFIMALFISVENVIIQTKLSKITPLASITLYGLCLLVVGGICWPMRRTIGLETPISPTPILPALIAGGLGVGLMALLASFALAGNIVQDKIDMTQRAMIGWILTAGIIFAVGTIVYFKAYQLGATPQLAVTVLSLCVPIFTGIIMSAIHRAPPSMNTVASVVLVVAAVMLLRRDLPDAPPPESVDSQSPPAAVNSQ